jgi:Ribosomal protein L22
MIQSSFAFAEGNSVRVSPLKFSPVARLIVIPKVCNAVNPFKFSPKRISKNVLKVLDAAFANAGNY